MAAWVPNAESRDLFGNDEMRLIGRSVVSADTLGQLFGGKQSVGFDHVALAVDPFGFNRVEPGALRRQQKGQDTHASPIQLDLPIVLTNPGAHNQAFMEGGHCPKSRASWSCLA